MKPVVLVFAYIASTYNESLYEKFLLKSIMNKKIEFSWKDIFNLFDIEKKLTPKELKKV